MARAPHDPERAHARGGIVHIKRDTNVGYTYSIANFRGLNDKTGNKAKQITKHAKAARLHAPKMSNRSHRLTDIPTKVSQDRHLNHHIHEDDRSKRCMIACM